MRIVSLAILFACVAVPTPHFPAHVNSCVSPSLRRCCHPCNVPFQISNCIACPVANPAGSCHLPPLQACPAVQVEAAHSGRSVLQSRAQSAISPDESAPEATPASKQPATTAGGASAPRPPLNPGLDIPAAVVTPIGSGADLRKAASQAAQDIEIREHLDLRGLGTQRNPRFAFEDISPEDVAMIYTFEPLRSIRVRSTPARRCRLPL